MKQGPCPFKNIGKVYQPLLLITAMRPEAEALLKSCAAALIKQSGKLRLYRFPPQNVYLLQTGMGPLPEEFAGQLLRGLRPGSIINFGICGALDSRLKPLDAYLIKSVRSPESPFIPVKYPFSFPEKGCFKNAALLTVPEPVVSRAKRQALWQTYNCPLVDMEAFQILKWGKKQEIPVFIIKIVSDLADEKAVEQVKNSIPLLQSALRQAVISLVEHLV
ncbi:MAG: hypothetical protein WAN36_12175 [Calditrichia bacterium]